MNSVERFLAALRHAVPDAETIFTQGHCYRLFLLLRTVYPEAEPYYDGDHVITRIEGRYYDIKGRKQKGSAVAMHSEPWLMRQAHRWTLS